MKTLRSRTTETGAERRRGLSGCWLALGAVVLVVLVAGGCATKAYNGMVVSQERVAAQWSEIDNQYKRRFDLVPQLVETVKGAADFEKSTITAVTEARTSVGKIQAPAGAPTDEASMKRYLAAQNELGGALSRLLVTVENYPNLKASQNFLALQDQLEGTENRIATARRDYIDAVAAHNTTIRKFPNTLLASSFGFETVAQLPADEDVRETPLVDFGGNE